MYSLCLIAILIPPILVWVRSRRWQYSIKFLILTVAVIAGTCGLARIELAGIEPHWGLVFLPIFMAWPLLISWIVTGLVVGPQRSAAGFSRPVASKSVRKRRFRLGQSKTASLEFGPLWVTVFYVVFHKTWVCIVWPLKVDLWSEVGESGFTLRSFDHAVNAVFIVYLLVAVWSRVTIKDWRFSIHDTPYILMLALLVAKHWAIPPM